MAEEQTPTLWFFMQCLTSHGRRRLLTTSPDTRTRGNKRNKMLIKTEVFKTNKAPFFPLFLFSQGTYRQPVPLLAVGC